MVAVKKTTKKDVAEVPATPETKIAEISKDVSVMQGKAAALVIKTPEDYTQATEFLVTLKARLKRVEELRLFFVEPIKKHAKSIDAMFKEQSFPLEQTELKVKRVMADYTMEQDRIARAEEERLAKLRAKQDERREEKGMEPVAVPLPTVERPMGTTQTVGGSATTRKVWKYRVTNLDAVPRELLRCEVAHVKVQAQIDGGARAIAGLEIYEDIEVSVRPRG